MKRFRTILVANRGEIACRIMRTAKGMGYRTAAVYSDADADALHVELADIATRIGPHDARSSYLDIDAILKAARRVDADAVHPGYGFLSENADFARACGEAGLVFIGPSADAIAAMGNKAAAKRRMVEAGVPCVPGYHGKDAGDADLQREAERIGFPLMVKAAAGGGGRGMRLVTARSELAAAIATARSEALNAFGSDELILEKAVLDARHVEVQILADTQGHCIHLGERDCSVQRRHQKVLEEAPSPAVDARLRARMGAAAVAAAKAIGYANAGTVEFLLAPDGSFYFLEMNTRLQVEHPVTEMVTGLDLVELQIRIAQGEALPVRQEDSLLHGHAMEARLYAEAPHKGFLPQSGELAAWRAPAGPGVRVDHGLKSRQAVSAHYDPMLAKVIAHGRTREEARLRLVDALKAAHLAGIASNRHFLIQCLEHPEFAAGAATTSFIAAHFPNVEEIVVDEAVRCLAAALLFEASAERLGHRPDAAWSSSGAIAWPLKIVANDDPASVIACTVSIAAPGGYVVRHGSVEHRIDLETPVQNARVRWRWQGQDRHAFVAWQGETLHLQHEAGDFTFRDELYAPPSAQTLGDSGEVRAPMNGKIVAVLAKPGDHVEKGQRLVVLEAMKMQHELSAGTSGTVVEVHAKLGDQVATRQVLVKIAAADAKA